MIDLAAFDQDAPAILISGQRHISYGDLGTRVARYRSLLAALPRPALVFTFAGNSPTWIAIYLACLAEGVPLGLGEAAGPARSRIIASYRPSAIVVETKQGPLDGFKFRSELGDGLALLVREDSGPFDGQLHNELALLLATSGSTGDPKLVRLSEANLRANAASIANYLSLTSAERAIQSLPLHYSYGLSILNSHLTVGASVALIEHSVLRPEFWRAVDEQGCTSFAGVPYMYETMQRLRISPKQWRTVRTLTQAGGHLRPELVRHFASDAATVGGRMFVMYGQTEATARMSYVSPERLMEKLGTIGTAVPGGRFSLEPVEGDPELQQLIYHGPNVMLGYANKPDDLAKGDEMGARLPTGDLGAVDGDGFYRITGRLARFAKLFGKRVSLASVEEEVESQFGVRCSVVDGGDRLRLFVESVDQGLVDSTRGHMASWLGVPPPTIEVKLLSQLPMTSSGKKDYKSLT